MKMNPWVSLCLCAVLAFSGNVYAVIYGGIDFPQGAQSFADAVIRSDPLYSGGPAPTDLLTPSHTLGIPDYTTSNKKALSLGRGGLVELQFIDNRLTNSGNATRDLHIFEVGPDVEDTFVAIRPTEETAALLGPGHDANGDGFYEIGKVFGSTSSIDIDAIFPGFAAGVLVFDAVQLIDDRNEGDATGPTVGADIDAVGAISSADLCAFRLIGDLNGDCAVNLLDLAMMAHNWLINCKTEPTNAACLPE